MDVWEVEMNRRILKKKFKTRWKKSMAELTNRGPYKVKPSRIKISEKLGENEIIIKGSWHGWEWKIKFPFDIYFYFNNIVFNTIYCWKIISIDYIYH